jgi:hypothetical protein
LELNVDPGKVLLVIGLTLLIVIGVNVVIYFSVTRKSSIGQIELLRRAAKQARNPWEVEDNSLAELSRLVADLKEKPSQEKDDNPAP